MTREEQFQKKLEEFWALANCAIKARQRKTFNVWRERLTVALDDLKNDIYRHSGPECDDPRFKRARETVELALNLVLMAPFLSP